MCTRSPSGLRTFLELRYSEPGYAAASLHAGKHNRPNFRESPECELRLTGVLEQLAMSLVRESLWSDGCLFGRSQKEDSPSLTTAAHEQERGCPRFRG